MSFTNKKGTKTPRTMKFPKKLDVENELIKLEFLSLELPDPNQRLYPQGEPPPQFVCFPKLPIELRLVIWRFMFPKPHRVRLSVGNHDIYKFLDHSLAKFRRHTSKPLPVSLFVCRESRAETLEHYSVYRHVSTTSPYPPKPICFKPVRDEFYFRYSEAHPYQWNPSPRLREHLPLLKAEASEQLAKIRKLRIESVRLLSDFNWYERIPGKDVESKFAVHNEFLWYFPGLRELALTFDVDLSRRGSTMKAMTTLLERNKDKFEGGTAPKVVDVTDSGTWGY